MGSGNEELPLLEIMITNKNGRIETYIQYKTNNLKRYLLFTSCYAKHIWTNILYRLAKKDLYSYVKFKNAWTKTGRIKRKPYIKCIPTHPHYQWYKKSNTLEFHNPRRVNHKLTRDILHYVSTFNPRNSKIFPHIHSNITIFFENTKMKTILQNQTIIKI